MLISDRNIITCELKVQHLKDAVFYGFLDEGHQEAITFMDIEDMLGCFDPTIVGFLRILPITTDGEELNELLITIIDLIIYMFDVDSVGAVVEFFESVRIRPKTIDIRLNRTVV